MSTYLLNNMDAQTKSAHKAEPPQNRAIEHWAAAVRLFVLKRALCSPRPGNAAFKERRRKAGTPAPPSFQAFENVHHGGCRQLAESCHALALMNFAAQDKFKPCGAHAPRGDMICLSFCPNIHDGNRLL
jgi:hypothetical protein